MTHLKYSKNPASVVMALGLWLIFSLFKTSVHATTRFSINDSPKSLPAAFDFNHIWYYDTDLSKIIPDINPEWIAVVFRTMQDDSGSVTPASLDENFIKYQADGLMTQHNELVDYLYDPTLAQDACFFMLRPDVKTDMLPSLIHRINEHEAVSYAHPTFTFNGQSYAFFNAFTLQWKTGVTETRKAAVLRQVPVFFDDADQVFRVNVWKQPFFEVFCLIAEDIHVARAEPYLVEIQPSIRGRLIIPMPGGNLGDPILFMLRIEFSTRVSIDPSSLAAINLRPETIQKELFDIVFDPYDYTKAVSASPIVITGKMKLYAPGDFQIPSVQIKYHCPKCSPPQDRSFATTPVMVRIASMVPASWQESNLIVPQEPLSINLPIAQTRRASVKHLALAGFYFVLAAAALIWCFFRMRSLNKEKESLGRKQRYGALTRKLQTLIQHTPDHELVKSLGNINALFREYLIMRFNIPGAPAGGTGAVFWNRIKNHLPLEMGMTIKDILAAMDHAAAHEVMDATAGALIRQNMLEILNSSNPGGGS